MGHMFPKCWRYLFSKGQSSTIHWFLLFDVFLQIIKLKNSDINFQGKNLFIFYMITVKICIYSEVEVDGPHYHCQQFIIFSVSIDFCGRLSLKIIPLRFRAEKSTPTGSNSWKKHIFEMDVKAQYFYNYPLKYVKKVIMMIILMCEKVTEFSRSIKSWNNNDKQSK